MPLYFFDTHNGSDPRIDRVGRELRLRGQGHQVSAS